MAGYEGIIGNILTANYQPKLKLNCTDQPDPILIVFSVAGVADSKSGWGLGLVLKPFLQILGVPVEIVLQLNMPITRKISVYS